MANGCPTVGSTELRQNRKGPLSTSICVVPRESTSGEMVEMVDNEADVKDVKLGESGEELEE